MRTENPWAGLASYQDPAVAERKMLFCGRENESQDLAELIEDNIFVTLYGKSGTGKTSLLNAGVFPLLRKRGFIPVSIRLGMEAHNLSFQSCIRGRVLKAVLEQGSVKSYDVVPEQKDEKAQDYLWTWFACRKFLDADGSPVFPVLVFDQFEEVFRERSADAEVLLRQINFLMDSSHQLPSGTVDGEPYEYDYNFRFLVSLREDDLYHLEDSIDNNYLPEMKHCRFRLRSLTEKGAREVILNPGGGLFGGADQETIVQTILKVARSSADNSISTNLLSLLCSRIFDEAVQSGTSQVSLEQVQRFVGGNPIIRFYQEATSFLTDTEREYLEDSFVDSSGRRNSVSEEEFLRHVKDGKRLLEGSGKILQRTSVSSDARDYRIELIHDSFCAPLAELREARLQRNRTRKRVSFIGISAISLAIVLLVGLYMYSNRKSLRRYQEKESIAATEKANYYIKTGKPDWAIRLLMSILPNNLYHPNRPVSKESLEALKSACSMSVRGFGDNETLDGLAVSGNWNTVVTLARGDVRIWDMEDGFSISLSGLSYRSSAYYDSAVDINEDGSFVAICKKDTLSILAISNWRDRLSDVVEGKGQIFPITVDNAARKGRVLERKKKYGYYWDDDDDDDSYWDEYTQKIKFVPTSNDVIVYGLSDTLQYCHIESGEVNKYVPVKGEVITDVGMSKEGAIAILTAAGQVYYGQSFDDAFIKVPFDANVGSICISPMGDKLALFGESSIAYIYDLLTLTRMPLPISEAKIKTGCFSSDGSFLSVLTISGRGGEWCDINMGDWSIKTIGKAPFKRYGVISIIHPGKKQWVESNNSSGDYSFAVKSLIENHLIADFRDFDRNDSTWVVCLTTNRQKTTLAAYADLGARVWNTSTRLDNKKLQLLGSRSFSKPQLLGRLTIDATGRVLTTHTDRTLRRWNADMSACIDSVRFLRERDTLRGVVLNHDESRLYVSTTQGFYILDAQSLDTLQFVSMSNSYHEIHLNHKEDKLLGVALDMVALHDLNDLSHVDTLISDNQDRLFARGVFSPNDEELMVPSWAAHSFQCLNITTHVNTSLRGPVNSYGYIGDCDYLDSNSLVVAINRDLSCVVKEPRQSWEQSEWKGRRDDDEEEDIFFSYDSFFARMPMDMVALPEQNIVIVSYCNGDVLQFDYSFDTSSSTDLSEYQRLLDDCRKRFERVPWVEQEIEVNWLPESGPGATLKGSFKAASQFK